MYIIETKDLTKKYNNKVALNNLNLRIKKGEVYGFIGRNGAGKTTTINLLLSLIHKSSGSIKINDKTINFTDVDYKKDIGYVPDVPVFPNYMNAKEYLTYACDMYDIPQENKKKLVDETLDFVELKDASKKIGAYSRGMKQRLGIAQALIHDPEIIIMDEPTSALDPIGRKDVMQVILKLKGKKTIFYSTHILEDVEKVCDRIGLLEEGTLILEDTMDHIKEKYYQSEVIITLQDKVDDAYSCLEKNGFSKCVKREKKDIICNNKVKDNAFQCLKLLVEKGYIVKEFKQKNASLEDVFIKVTHEKTI
jgi:ABC-2 type transport system ATP-binding protein